MIGFVFLFLSEGDDVYMYYSQSVFAPAAFEMMGDIAVVCVAVRF